MTKSIVAGVASIIVSGCVSTAMFETTPIVPDFERIEAPSIGEVATANLGDTVLKKGEVYTYPALQMQSDITKIFGIGGAGKYEIPAQKLVADGYNDKYIFYAAKGMKHSHSLAGTTTLAGGICVSRTDPKDIKISDDLKICFVTVDEDPGLIPTTIAAQNSPSFVQELIYNGRVGSSVRFLYREFSENMARPAFSQEAQYDLAESTVIGFKDARIEILDATNTELRYRVVQSFPDYN